MTTSSKLDGNLEGSNDLQAWKYIPEENDLVRSKDPKEENDNEPYILISSLTGAITHGSHICLIDSGASKYMTGY